MAVITICYDGPTPKCRVQDWAAFNTVYQRPMGKPVRISGRSQQRP